MLPRKLNTFRNQHEAPQEPSKGTLRNPETESSQARNKKKQGLWAVKASYARTSKLQPDSEPNTKNLSLAGPLGPANSQVLKAPSLNMYTTTIDNTSRHGS